MRSLVLLAATTLAAASAALPFGAPGLAQSQSAAIQTPASAAQVRAGVDAWMAGNYEEAVKTWQGPAATGDADALFNLGQAYKLGKGVPADVGKAEAMYGRAARLGHVRAADNYGILLFQTNRQQAAIPWLQAAADRGEPRAMYVLGIAAYNGDYAPKDWVRAYALVSRAATAGLRQATASLVTMNETIPLAQRQMGVSLASELEQKASDARGRELAAADLGAGADPMRPAPPLPAPPAPAPIETKYLSPAAPVGGPDDTPVLAGPDSRVATSRVATGRFATPQSVPPRPAAPKPTAPKPAASKPGASGNAPGSGPWRVQLGAFGLKSYADALWNRLRSRPEIAGHPRADIGSPVTRLLATGFSQAGAQRACAALKVGGFACLVLNP